MSDHSALLVIDVQLAMFDETDPVYAGDQLLKRIQHLLATARASGTPVIYVQHNEGPGEPLETHSTGWHIHPAIAPADGEIVIQKHTPDSFLDTTLQDELQRLAVHRLVLTGMQTEMCVDTTCRRAFSLRYDVVLVKDAHSTWGNGRISAEDIIDHHNKALRWFAEVQSADEVTF